MRLVLPVEVVQRQFASPQASRSLRLLTTHYWLPRKRPARVTPGSASDGRKFPWHQSPSDALYDPKLALHGQYPEVMVNGGRRGQPESLGEFLPGWRIPLRPLMGLDLGEEPRPHHRAAPPPGWCVRCH